MMLPYPKGGNLQEDLEEQEWVKLKQAETALEKIENEKFGTCTECEIIIPTARLEIIPYSEFCTQCLSKIGKNSFLTRNLQTLGSLNLVVKTYFLFNNLCILFHIHSFFKSARVYLSFHTKPDNQTPNGCSFTDCCFYRGFA